MRPQVPETDLTSGVLPPQGRCPSVETMCVLAQGGAIGKGDGQEPLPQELLHEQNLEAKRLSRVPSPDQGGFHSARRHPTCS